MHAKNSTVVVAGATGNLGQLIVKHLLKRKAKVKALVRTQKNKKATDTLIEHGSDVIQVDYDNPLSLTEACFNSDCVISALSGGLQRNGGKV